MFASDGKRTIRTLSRTSSISAQRQWKRAKEKSSLFPPPCAPLHTQIKVNILSSVILFQLIFSHCLSFICRAVGPKMPALLEKATRERGRGIYRRKKGLLDSPFHFPFRCMAIEILLFLKRKRNAQIKNDRREFLIGKNAETITTTSAAANAHFDPFSPPFSLSAEWDFRNLFALKLHFARLT